MNSKEQADMSELVHLEALPRLDLNSRLHDAEANLTIVLSYISQLKSQREENVETPDEKVDSRFLCPFSHLKMEMMMMMSVACLKRVCVCVCVCKGVHA